MDNMRTRKHKRETGDERIIEAVGVDRGEKMMDRKENTRWRRKNRR
jgi:hypothetical protein